MRRKFLPWQKLNEGMETYVCIDPTTGKPAIEIRRYDGAWGSNWQWNITINGHSNRGSYGAAMTVEQVQDKAQGMAEYFGFEVGDEKLLNLL